MMTTNTLDSFGDKLSKIISVIFHPLLMPVYGMLIIFSVPTLFGYLPFNVKKIFFLIILVNNVLVPLSLMPYFKYRKIISSWSVENRSERLIPLVATTFFYFISVYTVSRFHIPFFLKYFILTTALLSCTITIIHFWIKISIHAAGAGTLMILIALLSIRMQIPLTLLLTSTILSAGLILSSRLWLNSHNPKEVWLGFLLGVAVPPLLLLFFG